MLLYRTNLGERINLDLVERVMERPEAIELHMVSGTTRTISGAGVAALQAALAEREAKAPKSVSASEVA